MKVIRNISVLVFVCSFLVQSKAQNQLGHYQEKYPGKNGVFLTKAETVSIYVGKEGVPVVEIDHDEERLFLNENYKYYTEESVSFSSFTNIKSINAVVYTLDNGKYKKSKITDIVEEDDTDRSVFHDDLRKKKFFYRGLKKGGKTTLNYTKELNEPHFYGSFYFSSYLPVESAKYIVETPVDMEISFKLFGDEKEKVKYKVETVGKNKIHVWEAANMNELKSEPQSVGFKYYATHLQLYINSYNHKGERKHLIRDLDDLYAYYQGFVRDVNKGENPELEKLADSLTKNKTSDDEKVKAILYWVQDNIKYIAFEAGMGGFIPREAALVCDRRYGDCKDMSSILYKMINSIGIPAYYTWLGSRAIPYKYREVPTPSTDNHMICSYFNGKDYIFLDATGKGVSFGIPTSFIQGKEALVGINEKEYKIVEVPIIEANKNLTVDTVYVRIKDDLLVGKGTVIYRGYPSIYLSSLLKNVSEKDSDDFFEDSFKKGSNKCESKVKETRGVEDRESDLEIDYEFTVPDYLRKNENELYLNPFLSKYLSGDFINLETNKNDIEDRFKQLNRNVIYIKVPENYTVDYIPESVSYQNDYFSCEVSINLNESKSEIEIKTVFNFNYIILPSEEFAHWNEMIKLLNRTYSELIIFKKKN